MPSLNDLLYDVRRISESREALTEKRIRKIFKLLLEKLNGFIGNTYTKYADDEGRLYISQLQGALKQARFFEELAAHVESFTDEEKAEMLGLVDEVYKKSYSGMAEAVKKANTKQKDLLQDVNVPSDVIERAVNNNVNKLTLSSALEKHRAEIVYSIQQSITTGLITGDRYETMAKRIEQTLSGYNGTKGMYGKACNIARTETHRNIEGGMMDSAEVISDKLVNSGFIYAATWRTMKDERVRPQHRTHTKKGWKTTIRGNANHMAMEGKTVKAGEFFDLGSGVKAKAPGQSGDAGNDCNCRCYLEYELMTFEEFAKATGKSVDEVQKSFGNAEKSVDNSAESGIIKSDIDYMSNSFRPKFGKESINVVGNINISVKKVNNSQFDMYTDVDNTEKNKAVRLTEKNLHKVVEQMPKGFEMPKICVVDFEKDNLLNTAIGGYDARTKTMYINSKYDTPEKIKGYVNKNAGYFSNSTELAPYFHELGHKQYEDGLRAYAEKHSITIDQARDAVENKLMNFVGQNRKNDMYFLENNVSKYADDGYLVHKYSEIFAECFSADSRNNVQEQIIKLVKE